LVNSTENNNIIIGPHYPSSNIDKEGLFVRGVRDYVTRILLLDDQTDLYDAHFAEYAVAEGKAIPKHQYFLQLYQHYADKPNEHDFWKYLVKWRDMIYWDYVIDSEAYLPHPQFTKILRKSYKLYPPHGELRHLPLDTSYKSLVHDTFNNLQQISIDEYNGKLEKCVLIVPSNTYGEHFIQLYGSTTDDDLYYGSTFREFDDFMHPRIKPLVYAGIGFGIGYGFKRQQMKYSDIVWKRRMYRCARWTANGVTAGTLGIYWLATCYFNLISSHSYCNQTVAKQIDTMKQDAKTQRETKRKWTDFIFRRVVPSV